jgi:kinesin family protein 11
MKDMETQMQALDDFVTRARSQNAQHHDSHVRSLGGLSATVKSSYANIGDHFTSTYERVRDLGDEMSTKTSSLQDTLAPLESILQKPLIDLRSTITSTTLQEYQPTGETPQKIQYQYPTELPRTAPHENLLAALRRPSRSSPSKPQMVPVIFNDAMDGISSENNTATSTSLFSASMPATTTGGLREIDVNINAASLNISPDSIDTLSKEPSQQHALFKRSTSGKLPVLRSGKKAAVAPAEGRENSAPVLAQSTGRRRSPRTG